MDRWGLRKVWIAPQRSIADIVSSMLYYDRRLTEELLSLLFNGGPLSWLVAHSRADPQTRIEFRRADGERRLGSIQLYRGRTNPVEVLGLAKGQVARSTRT